MLHDIWSFKFGFNSLRDRAFGTWYKDIADDFFAFEKDSSPVPRLVGSAYGTVLEIGPATGNQLPRFDKSKVDLIYGVEPCQSMHVALSKTVEATGWCENYVQLVCAIEDEKSLATASIDSVVSIQVLCSVQNPEVVVKKLYDLLKPGGQLLFWEHRESNDWLTKRIQRM